MKYVAVKAGWPGGWVLKSMVTIEPGYQNWFRIASNLWMTPDQRFAKAKDPDIAN